MNTQIIKSIGSTLVIFALLLSAVAAPVVAVAQVAPFGGFTIPAVTIPTIEAPAIVYTTCKITAEKTTITAGEDVVLTWTTSGFTDFTLNGEVVDAPNDTIVIPNVQEDQVYTFVATNDSGSKCTTSVRITCLPAPVECKLEIDKEVNASTARVGDELTYTIHVQNIGDGDCTGDGVLITDVLDADLEYLSNTVSSNLSAGYGSNPVYTSSDRTLRFNGHTLNPGESGTITVTVRVSSPATCGDFEVTNQARATAFELNNFNTWVYSPTVRTQIDNDCVVVQPACERFDANPVTINPGQSSVLSWETVGDLTVFINNGIGVQPANGETTVSPAETTVYRLSLLGPNDQEVVSCETTVIVTSTPVPSCDMFTATPSTISVGESSILTWETTNAVEVYINNGVGTQAADNTTPGVSVSPLSDITYVLTAIGTDGTTVDCTTDITVVDIPVFSCANDVIFTATPNTLPAGGGSVLLNWSVDNAVSASISPTIGTVALVGSTTTPVIASTNFVLTAINGAGDEISCPAPVTVEDPEPTPFSCANNVDFSVTDSSIEEGESTTLNWTTTSVDSVFVSVVNSTALNGSVSVSPSSDTTYVLTATKGGESVNCPVSVNVSPDGGGGGGTPKPRCELEISDAKITAGETITLEWNTSNATELTITDDEGEVVFTTDSYLSDQKKEYFDGSIKLKPTRDTEYTLVAERGSRDTECMVKVAVEDDVVLLQARDQQPLVAGISLNQVPYTGFEAGPIMTVFFYLLLIAWALYITYLLVVRQQAAVATSAAGAVITMPSLAEKTYVAPVVAQATTQTAPATPTNLPIATPVVGYENQVEESSESVNPHQVSDVVVTNLENRAHQQKALLSSDAVRYFIATTEGAVERDTALDEVISEAKKHYPLEDGWIVINEARMNSLCATCIAGATVAKAQAPFVPATVPEGTGSLAEAIVTGNIVAAYEMIGNRPMFALADAAADLDAVYRNRRGAQAHVSDLLAVETATMSDEKIKNMIAALTGALDGVYTDEASAVKMAIMKAVKEGA